MGVIVALVLLAATWANRMYGGRAGIAYQARLLYLDRVQPLWWPAAEYSSEQWRAAPLGERYRFAKSIIRSRVLLGRTREEVGHQLGSTPSTDSAIYALRATGFQNLWWVLAVNFEHGRVKTVSRTLAWLDP